MRTRRALAAALAALAAVGCGDGDDRSTSAAPPPPVEEAAPDPPPSDPIPPPPGTPPVSRAAYLAALDRYCRASTRAVERLVRAPVDETDPVGPIEVFARRYRAAIDRLGARTPPGPLRRLHLLTLAQARESAARVDDGVRLGRRGDTDAATTALGELEGLLPRGLPASVRRGAPACD